MVVGVVLTIAGESSGDGIIITRPAVVDCATADVLEPCGTSSWMSMRLGRRIPTEIASGSGGRRFCVPGSHNVCLNWFSRRVFNGPLMVIPVISGVVRVGVLGAGVGTGAVFIK